MFLHNKEIDGNIVLVISCLFPGSVRQVQCRPTLTLSAVMCALIHLDLILTQVCVYFMYFLTISLFS